MAFSSPAVQIPRVGQCAVPDEGGRSIGDGVAPDRGNVGGDPRDGQEPFGLIDPFGSRVAVQFRDVFDGGGQQGVPSRPRELRALPQHVVLPPAVEAVEPPGQVVEYRPFQVAVRPFGADRGREVVQAQRRGPRRVRGVRRHWCRGQQDSIRTLRDGGLRSYAAASSIVAGYRVRQCVQ